MKLKIVLKFFYSHLLIAFRSIWKKEHRDLFSTGYEIKTGVVNPQKTFEVCGAIDDLIEQNQFNWTDGSDFRIYQAEKLEWQLNFRELFQEADNLASVFHGKNLIFTDLVARISFNENNLGSGGGWHRDSPFPQFKSIIYLSEASEETGSFQIVPRSQLAKSILFVAWKIHKNPFSYRFTNEEMVSLRTPPVSLVGEAGDQLFVASNAIHRGMPLKRGNRYAITRYYFSSQTEKESFLAGVGL